MTDNLGIYQLIDKLAKFAYLNLLWLVASLPLITIFSSTLALCSVVRQWSQGIEEPITKTFFGCLLSNFKQSFKLGIAQLLVYGIFIADLYVILQMDSSWKIIWLGFFLFLGIILLLFTVNMYFLSVYYQMTFRQLLRNALYIIAKYPKASMLQLIVLVLSVFMCTVFPFLVYICAVSITVFLLHRIFFKVLQQISIIPESK